MAAGSSFRRETRSHSLPHSAQCISQSSRKRRRVAADTKHLGQPTCRRRPILLQSVINSCLACVLEALRSGVSIDFRDDDGYTALMVAVEVGSLEMVELLINQRADATMRNSWGETALHLAVSRSGPNARSIVGRLLTCDRSSVNLRPVSGCTPLFRAAGSCHQDALAIVRDLIEANADLEVRGSDPDVLNGREMAPFELAVTVGNFEVCQLLYQAGCSIGVVHEWMRGTSFPRSLLRNRQWMETLVGWATQPRMLQMMCSNGIRKAVISSGNDVRQVRETELPLPFSLANLVLRDS